jgi:hypothetical protein
MPKWIKLLIGLFVALVLCGVMLFLLGERPTHVRIDGGTIPVFHLSGSGEVAIFTIYSPDYMTKATQPGDEKFALWQIEPIEGYFHGVYIGELGKITYGVVPAGYAQLRPLVGNAPPLTENTKYSYFVETTDAAGAGGYFEIRNSRAFKTSGTGPCFQSKNQNWVNVPCPRVGPED